MSKTEINNIVRKFCVEQRKGVGFTKYIKAAGRNASHIYFHPDNFDDWYTGPGEYSMLVYDTYGREGIPMSNYTITLP